MVAGTLALRWRWWSSPPARSYIYRLTTEELFLTFIYISEVYRTFQELNFLIAEFYFCGSCIFKTTATSQRKKFIESYYNYCATDFSLLNLPKGKSLGRSKPATSSYAQALQQTVRDDFYYIQALLNCLL